VVDPAPSVVDGPTRVPEVPADEVVVGAADSVVDGSAADSGAQDAAISDVTPRTILRARLTLRLCQ